jgi:hypothetical protein
VTLLVAGRLFFPPQSAIQQGQAPRHEPRAEVTLEKAADVDRRFELLRRAEKLVEANERYDAVHVGLEASLLPQSLEHDARRLQIAAELADPRFGEDG